MFNLDSSYSNYFDMSDENYPEGKAVDAATDEDVDGTPYLAKWMNNTYGAFQALFFKAFGDLKKVSGKPDNFKKSDILDALMQIISDSFSGRVFQFETKESEVLIPWSRVDKIWNSTSKYLVVANVAEENGHFCVNSFITQEGIKLVVTEAVNGSVKPMTRLVKFGSSFWGAKKWGEKTPYKINLIIQEVLKNDRNSKSVQL